MDLDGKRWCCAATRTQNREPSRLWLFVRKLPDSGPRLTDTCSDRYDCRCLAIGLAVV